MTRSHQLRSKVTLQPFADPKAGRRRPWVVSTLLELTCWT